MVGLSFQVLPFPVNQFFFSGGPVSTNINDDSIEVFCKMLMDAIKVKPEARPVIISLIETLMDNHAPQEFWGAILFRVWQQLNDEPSEGKETP
jgi:hypothetical protein